ncbi:MAG TPA: phosphotransferase [Candidatus Eisenbacteria bacterium]
MRRGSDTITGVKYSGFWACSNAMPFRVGSRTAQAYAALGERLLEILRSGAHADTLRQELGDPGARVELGLARPAGYSVLYPLRIELRDIRATLDAFVKVRREARNGPFLPEDASSRAAQLAAGEYEALLRAHRYFSATRGGLGVVRPLLHLPEFHAIVVTRAKGDPLDQICYGGGRHGASAAAASGAWLRHYHRGVHAAHRLLWDSQRFLEGIDVRMERLLQRGVPRTRLEALRESIGDAARAVGPAEIHRSLLHGDYKLRHIYTYEGGIEVLDFGNSLEGDCSLDIAAFVVEVEVFALSNPRVNHERLQMLTEAFLEGYFEGMPVPPTTCLYVVDALLKKWERRIIRWSPARAALAIQGLLHATRIGPILERAYLDPWFRARIRHWLAAARRGMPA